MNPYDAIGTARIGQAVYDRLCRIAIGYQDEDHEREITARVVGALPDGDIELAVMIARATREHADLRTGSSVRGAIDLAMVAAGLYALRRCGGPVAGHRDVVLDAALAALSGRIRVDEACDRSPEDIVTEIVDAQIEAWRRRHQPAEDGQPGDDGATREKVRAPASFRVSRAGAASWAVRRRARPSKRRHAAPTDAPSCSAGTSPSTTSRPRSAASTTAPSKPCWPTTPTPPRRCSPTSPTRPTAACAPRPAHSPPVCSSAWRAGPARRPAACAAS